jgi:hypothetical protein
LDAQVVHGGEADRARPGRPTEREVGARYPPRARRSTARRPR